MTILKMEKKILTIFYNNKQINKKKKQKNIL